MKILITGAEGFIGKNLCATLEQQERNTLIKIGRETSQEELVENLNQCEFIFHLAGVNRPNDEQEFFKGNTEFTENIIRILGKRNVPIVFASSIQAGSNNAYGESKRKAEQILLEYKKYGAKVYIYRLPNIFGKWSRPNYNSVVATFCHNIARDIPIEIHDPDREIRLCYIDDVVNEFVRALNDKPTWDGEYCIIPTEYKTTLGYLSDTIKSFKESRRNLSIAEMSNPLIKHLYTTFLSFLPEDHFKYPLKMNVDVRGSFTEFIRTNGQGQISINIAKPGITKGNHWHHSKVEKFLVVSGEGIIRFRKIGEDKIIEYRVNGDNLEVLDIPPGYIHNIENLGNTNLVTVMWANEEFNPLKPDTYYEKV